MEALASTPLELEVGGKEAPAAGDPDLDILCADALMTTSPWDYYYCGGGGTIESAPPCRMDQGSGTLRADMLLARGLLVRHMTNPRDGDQHPLTYHLLIHLTEPSGAPEEETKTIGLQAADALMDMSPAAGHLQHMPAHVYMRLGMWSEGIAASEGAAKANQAYLDRCLEPYAHGHNLRMGGWHARMSGQLDLAIHFATLHREGDGALKSFGASLATIDGCSNISSEEVTGFSHTPTSHIHMFSPHCFPHTTHSNLCVFGRLSLPNLVLPWCHAPPPHVFLSLGAHSRPLWRVGSAARSWGDPNTMRGMLHLTTQSRFCTPRLPRLRSRDGAGGRCTLTQHPNPLTPPSPSLTVP